MTMVGTGSEMNGGAVITNYAEKLKIGHVFGEEVFPKFAVLNPEFTFTGSRISDEIGNLRYHVPHSRTIFFG